MIITANTFFSRCKDFNEYRLREIIQTMRKRGIREQGYDEDSPPLKAFVNNGKWIAICECGGGEKVWEEGWFMCLSCLNASHGHKYRRTVFPKSRKSIEGILEQRPLPNRNWFVGETLAKLRAENEEHKSELLEVQ